MCVATPIFHSPSSQTGYALQVRSDWTGRTFTRQRGALNHLPREYDDSVQSRTTDRSRNRPGSKTC